MGDGNVLICCSVASRSWVICREGREAWRSNKTKPKKKTRIHARRRAVVGQVVYSFSEESYFHPFSHTFLPMSERVKGGIERGWGFCCSFFFTRATAGTRHRSTRSTFSHPLCHLGRLCSVGTGRFSVELFFFIDALNVCVCVCLCSYWMLFNTDRS